MTYQEMLKWAINESGWSMREISKRCKQLEVSVSQVYLSQLSRGEANPASDKVNKALGKIMSVVVDIDPDALYIAAYREKIPCDVLEKLAIAK